MLKVILLLLIPLVGNSQGIGKIKPLKYDTGLMIYTSKQDSCNYKIEVVDNQIIEVYKNNIVVLSSIVNFTECCETTSPCKESESTDLLVRITDQDIIVEDKRNRLKYTSSWGIK